MAEPDLGRICEPRHLRRVIAGHQHEHDRLAGSHPRDHRHLAAERVGGVHQAAQQAQRQLTLGAGRAQRLGHLVERRLRVCELPDLHRRSIARRVAASCTWGVNHTGNAPRVPDDWRTDELKPGPAAPGKGPTTGVRQ
jgi:hypothetical protein